MIVKRLELMHGINCPVLVRESENPNTATRSATVCRVSIGLSPDIAAVFTRAAARTDIALETLLQDVAEDAMIAALKERLAALDALEATREQGGGGSKPLAG